MELTIIVLFMITVFISHFIEGITGFGATMLALPFCAKLVGVDNSIPVLVVLTILFDTVIVIREFKNVDFKQLKIILFYMIIGLVAGVYIYIIYSKNNPFVLSFLLGIFMICISVFNIYKIVFRKIEIINSNSYLKKTVLIIGGIFHGALGAICSL